MAEKTLKTRILTKIDTLENWNSSTLVLKQGEIALATVAASAGTGLTEPVIMAKIGTDEGKTFSQLPWAFHAKAADVLEAAKSEAGLKAFVNTVIAEAGIATNEALTTLAGRVTTVEGLVGDTEVATQISNAINNLNLANTYDAKGSADQALTDAKGYADELNEAMDARVQVVEGKAHEHANKAELDLIATGDKAKWDAMEQNAKDYADDLDEAMDTRVLALEAKFGDGEGNVESQIEDAVAAEKTAREEADADLQEQITNLQGLVGDRSVTELIAAEQTRAEAAEKANSDAIAVLNGNSSVEGSVDKKVADALNEFATQISDDNTVNTYKELINYAATHGAEFTELVGEVDANTSAIATLNGDASTAGSVDKKIADAIAAENLDQYATDTELGAVDTRLQAVEDAIGESGSVAGDIADALAEAKEYTDAEVKELSDGAVATNAANIAALQTKVGDKAVATQINEAIAALAIGDYAKAADLTAEVNRAKAAEEANAAAAAAAQSAADKAQEEVDALETKVGTIEENLGLKANTADLHAIATSGSVMDLVQNDGDVLVFDCGNATA